MVSVLAHTIPQTGQERFSVMCRVYYKQATACVIVFDISRRSTFQVRKGGRKGAGEGGGRWCRRRNSSRLRCGVGCLAAVQEVLKWKEDLDDKTQLPNGDPLPCILLANKVWGNGVGEREREVV